MSENIYTQQIYDYKIVPGETKLIALELFGPNDLLIDLSVYNIYFIIFDPQTKDVIPMAAPGSTLYSMRNRTPENTDYSADTYEGIYRYGDSVRTGMTPPDYFVDNLNAINKIIVELKPSWSEVFTQGVIYPCQLRLERDETGEVFVPIKGHIVSLEGKVE